ncbi:hypothetical protein Tco_0951300 [Tanacetum coccineum]|uniref:Uncharacterized protein n=1 Tax=Tanacetum coccineum TaxID=301880 RepID=A0ABQ5DTR8_9ASTR
MATVNQGMSVEKIEQIVAQKPQNYKRDCPELKNQNHGDQARSIEARGVVHAFVRGETKQDLNNIEDEIEA